VANISVTVTFQKPGSEVWKAIREFGEIIRWAPGIAQVKLTGSGVGAVRTITFQDGTRSEERLESLNDASRTLSYTILESTLPVEGYVASLTVRDLGAAGCEVEWYSTFGAKGAAENEVSRMLEVYYRKALAGLQKFLRR
jgi:NADPH2:quinone reductase